LPCVREHRVRGGFHVVHASILSMAILASSVAVTSLFRTRSMQVRTSGNASVFTFTAQVTVMPPSTMKYWPVIKAALSLAR
jgi:hypothetical protein